MINVSVHLLDDDHPVVGAVGLLLQLERVPLDDNAAARDQDHIHRAHLHNGLPFKEGIYIYKNAKCTYEYNFIHSIDNKVCLCIGH